MCLIKARRWYHIILYDHVSRGQPVFIGFPFPLFCGLHRYLLSPINNLGFTVHNQVPPKTIPVVSNNIGPFDTDPRYFKTIRNLTINQLWSSFSSVNRSESFICVWVSDPVGMRWKLWTRAKILPQSAFTYERWFDLVPLEVSTTPIRSFFPEASQKEALFQWTQKKQFSFCWRGWSHGTLEHQETLLLPTLFSTTCFRKCFS